MIVDDDKPKAFVVAMLKLVRQDARVQEALIQGATPDFITFQTAKREGMAEDAVRLLREITGA